MEEKYDGIEGDCEQKGSETYDDNEKMAKAEQGEQKYNADDTDKQRERDEV